MTVVCQRCCEKRANDDCISKNDNSNFICYFCLRHYEPDQGKKRSKKLEKCDVFTLDLTKSVFGFQSHYYSFVEWGKAKEMKKVLVLIRHPASYSYESCPWYKSLVTDSKKSFKDLSMHFRNNIIRMHPNLEFSTYSDYKEWLLK